MHPLVNFLMPALLAAPPAAPAPEAAVAAVLDDWHLAAAQADENRYFGHLAEEAVFLGTDGSERWGKAAFRVFAHPFFAEEPRIAEEKKLKLVTRKILHFLHP